MAGAPDVRHRSSQLEAEKSFARAAAVSSTYANRSGGCVPSDEAAANSCSGLTRSMVPGVTAPDPKPRRPPGLAATHAAVTAGAILALIDVAFVVLLVDDGANTGMQLHHTAYVAGHALLLGLLAATAIAAWQRVRRPAATAALAGLALVGTWLWLSEDLQPRSAKLGEQFGVPPILWLILLVVVAAALVIAAFSGGRWLRRGPRCLLGIVFAVFAGFANHMVLRRNYPGVHLHVDVLVITLLTATLTGEHARRPRSTGWWGRLTVATMAAFGVWSVTFAPPSSVVVRALSCSGNSLVPFVARAHATVRSWARTYAERRYDDERADRPPSQPALIEKPIVLLVSVDCLRADIVEAERYAQRLPTLHALRRQGAYFRAFRTTAPATIVALSSAFTGRYFSQLYWSTRASWSEAWPHRDESERVSDILNRHGVDTAFVHGVFWMAPERGIVGHFGEEIDVPPKGGDKFPHAEPLTSAALRRAKGQANTALLIYMHWLEPHAPYDLGGTQGPVFERYLREVELVDRQLARLSAWVDETPRALLIVTSDHGEAFNEHASATHGGTLYDEVVRVPFIVYGSAIEAHIVDQLAGLIDLAPTLLDLFGLTTPKAMMGQSLLPALRGAPLRDQPSIIDGGRLTRAMVFADGYKVIHDRRMGVTELYDLRADAREVRNLVDLLPAEAQMRKGALQKIFRRYELRRPGYTLPFRPP